MPQSTINYAAMMGQVHKFLDEYEYIGIRRTEASRMVMHTYPPSSEPPRLQLYIGIRN